MDETITQREYYARTAASYDQAHLRNTGEPEHDIALAILGGLAGYYGFGSFLDVGCGTGRAIVSLRERFPGSRIEGIEPVAELREQAFAKGIPRDTIREGDATRLAEADGSFDCVTAFGILHHIRRPRLALAEMLRVARRGVFLSDLNNFGCGGAAQRLFSQSLNAVGLWKAFRFLVTRGKGYKISEGDGLHYSYSLYNDLPFLERQCREVYVMNTRGPGMRPYQRCSHVAILALK
jgi:ubiquinone/menaquinone biosynthesis C-methylase UbiE